MADYDAIVIGSGHNGLTASCYLAKAGLKVLTLEKNSFVGGLASTQEVFPDCKYGRPSQKPIILMSIPSIYDPSMAPEGKYAASLYIQFAPYDLAEGSWDKVKEELADRAVAVINEYAPNFRDSIIQRKVFSPLDYENMFGATRGNLWHGDILPMQMFTFRPVPGWSQYRIPIKGLYLCGASAHPGGGVTGAPGHNAAHVALEEWEKSKPE